jgi:ABC-type phosphate transport system substrate-binding protein
MPTRPNLLLCLAILVAAAPVSSPRAAPPEVTLVAHADVPADTLSRRQVERIYLGKTTRWEGGLSVQPVLFQGEPTHETFVREMLGRSPESFSVYWKRMVFTGKGRPPQAFEDPEALRAHVRETPGAIGFLPAGADVADLKVIALP